jgi:methionyl-tRNA synthetase
VWAQVFGHGFLTKDGLKMGKSLGNTLDPQALVSSYGPDAVRFFFMRDIVFGWVGQHQALTGTWFLQPEG